MEINNFLLNSHCVKKENLKTYLTKEYGNKTYQNLWDIENTKQRNVIQLSIPTLLKQNISNKQSTAVSQETTK